MKKGLSLLGLLLIFLAWPMTAAAETEAGYNITPLFPAEQYDEINTYFDLTVTPDTTTHVGMDIHNTSDYEKKINIGFNTATTNKYGVIDYTKEKVVDNSLKIQINELVSGPKSVTIPAKETKRVAYTVQVPEKSFDGILLGGFFIEEEYPEDRPSTNQMIDNTFSYTVALRMQENEKKIRPDLVLNEINQGVHNYKNTVFANLQNPTATIINDLYLQVKVKDLETQETIVSFEKSHLQMAPNSNFDLPIEYAKKYIPVGSYEMQITAQDGKENSWRLNKKFQIKRKDANTFEERQIAAWVKWVAVIIIGLLIVILALLIFLLKKKNRGQQE